MCLDIPVALGSLHVQPKVSWFLKQSPCDIVPGLPQLCVVCPERNKNLSGLPINLCNVCECNYVWMCECLRECVVYVNVSVLLDECEAVSESLRVGDVYAVGVRIAHVFG